MSRIKPIRSSLRNFDYETLGQKPRCISCKQLATRSPHQRELESPGSSSKKRPERIIFQQVPWRYRIALLAGALLLTVPPAAVAWVNLMDVAARRTRASKRLASCSGAERASSSLRSVLLPPASHLGEPQRTPGLERQGQRSHDHVGPVAHEGLERPAKYEWRPSRGPGPRRDVAPTEHRAGLIRPLAISEPVLDPLSPPERSSLAPPRRPPIGARVFPRGAQSAAQGRLNP